MDDALSISNGKGAFNLCLLNNEFSILIIGVQPIVWTFMLLLQKNFKNSKKKIIQQICNNLVSHSIVHMVFSYWSAQS